MMSGWVDVIRGQNADTPSKESEPADGLPPTPEYRENAFYWVKLKPYDKFKPDRIPDWEPMQRFRGKWLRVGMLHRFTDEETEAVGAELPIPGKTSTTQPDADPA